MCEKYAVLYVYRCGHQCAYCLLYAAREIGLPAMPRDDRGRGASLCVHATTVSLPPPANFANMPPKKRARTAAAAGSSSSSSQPATAAPKLTLSGGVPHHASLVALWRDDRLTDFAVSAEGVEFKAHRAALASC